MNPHPAEVANAALNLVGIPYRLCGRDPEFGLDCIGVVVAAYAACGAVLTVPPAYTFRQLDFSAFECAARKAGLTKATDDPVAGDIAVVRTGPAQKHVLLCGPKGEFVHAHAGLRRVALQPAPLPWPIETTWRTLLY